jgi:toxin ParE1/3/4
MKGFVLSRAAQRDLDDIWDYSAETWSPAQANRYVEHIRGACEKLGNGRARGRSSDDIRLGYWKFVVKSHFLYYRVLDGDLIDIVRILHQRMDVEAHL